MVKVKLTNLIFLINRITFEKNRKKYLLKNYSFLILIFVLSTNFIINILEIIVFSLSLQPRLALYCQRAWYWIIIMFPLSMKNRWIIQKKLISGWHWQVIKKYFGDVKLQLLFTHDLTSIK